MSALKYKVALLDENNNPLGVYALTLEESVILKSKFPGDEGVKSELKKHIDRMIVEARGYLYPQAREQCNALGITPTDFVTENGLRDVEYGVIKAWVTHPSYRDAEGQALTEYWQEPLP